MAADSHENPGGDAEGEGNAVQTRSRRASCEEELPSYSSSSCAPSGAANRRFSLPVALPAPPDTLEAAPLPEYNQQRPRDTVLSMGMLPVQSVSFYRACPHRARQCQGGPPCYLCSVLDMPPKYRKREAQGWHRLKEKLAQLSHITVSSPQAGRPLGHNPPATVFTISEWRPSNTTGAAPAEGVPASPCAAHDHGRAQERDNPAFEAQDSVEGGMGHGACWGAAPQLPAANVARNTEGVSFQPLPSPLPSTAYGQLSPPPYSPTFITDSRLPSFFPHEDDPEAASTSRCTRRLVCQLLYSLLLATASSTLIVSYDQPILVITSVIVFLAMFVFLPIISILECLFRCKMEQDFRQYLHSVMVTHPQQANTQLVF